MFKTFRASRKLFSPLHFAFIRCVSIHAQIRRRAPKQADLLKGIAVSQHWPLSRRALRGSCRCRFAADCLLLRRDWRRCLEKQLMAASTGNQSAMVQCLERALSARSRLLTLIQTRFMWAWVSRRFAATCRTAMVFTNRLMQAKRGSASVSKTHDRSRASAYTRRIPISFMLRRWAMFLDQTINAESFVQRMAAKRGKRF